MTAIVTQRADRGRPLTWIQIGAVAGPTAPIPSAALRAARLQIVGSGQGSVSTHDNLAELPPWPTKSPPAASGRPPTRPARRTSKKPGPPPTPNTASSSSRSCRSDAEGYVTEINLSRQD